jgi:hypothetical protein
MNFNNSKHSRHQRALFRSTFDQVGDDSMTLPQRINAFNPGAGAFLGTLTDPSGRPISIDQL